MGNTKCYPVPKGLTIKSHYIISLFSFFFIQRTDFIQIGLGVLARGKILLDHLL
jgi:hypothetical protein